jgi:hypothetical protein
MAESWAPMAKVVPSGENFTWLISFWEMRLQKAGLKSESKTLTVPSLQPITMNF